ncbi:Quinoprotein glucose dehydrogenase B precursor [Posidoniimonas polymericola]|uniref:Quinoprotein glucose dehydrogenase B n=1 Tax=Posidoniimonas polymericola TaxID=2528002 RepID=A0A5C5YTK5_9BACT|nr:NPCBM/NEW2 domain-containing protein [Posidoniimonas polymericola]TWT78329.1 Quinoprotein glucose dehydrogenase B precursor [Posidoniimonas polymericola]
MRRRRVSMAAQRPLRFESLEDRRLLAVVPAGFTESVVASGLTSPITMDIEDSGRIWLAYQDGRIEVIENDQLLPTPAVQLDADGSGERGLQGIELDPEFESNGYLYVYYTAASPESHNRLSRLTVDPLTENTIVPGSELVLLDLPYFSTFPQNQDPIWHMGGAIHFLQDGTIAVQVGDHLNNSLVQDLDEPLGKVLRVNPDGTPAADNPHYDLGDGISWQDFVWAAGLRNPFSGDVDPATGRYFINDVGQGSWEEINDATAGGENFGWPTTEGAFNQAQYPDFTQPFHAYSHAEDVAITGGAFNSPAVSQFPAEYQGKYFYSQFGAGRIMVIDPNNAADNEAFLTGTAFPMNIEFAADGSMYYIARGAGAGGAPGIGTGQVLKVQYAADIPPQIIQQPADRFRSVGYSATFTASAAGSSPLSYQWERDSGTGFTPIPGATEAFFTLESVGVEDSGSLFRVVVSNGFGTATSDAATLEVTTDTPPTPTVTLPLEGDLYRAGDLITFTGSATDAEDGVLAPSQLTWQVDFHHDEHLHPFLPATTGLTGAQFTVPVNSETAANVWFRIHLTATDSAGLTTETYRDIHPVTSVFTPTSNVDGVAIEVDGQPKETPTSITGVVNVNRALNAPAVADAGGLPAYFAQWLDGEASRDRVIATPEQDSAFVALYQTYDLGAPTYASDLTPSAPPVNGWGPIELDSSNGEDAAGDGGPITLNDQVYAKGLGVHAYSEITYDLNGGYHRFVSDIGLDDENAPAGSVEFRVLADGQEVFASGVMNNQSPTQTVDLDVTGVTQITLVVDDGGNGVGNDHADWADARFYSIEATPVVNLNFQPAGAEVPAGDLADTGAVFGDRGNGWTYGWQTDHTDLSRDRDVNADQRLDTLVHFHAGQDWEIALPNGQYLVTASVGDAGFPSTHTLNVEGLNFWTAEALAADEFAVQTRLVTVSDGRLTLDQGDAADKATRINYLEIAAVDVGATLLPFAAADVDLNGRLDLDDVAAFGAGWGADGTSASLEDRLRLGDLDFDGDTDQDDWEVFYSRWIAESNAPLSFDAVINPTAGDFDRTGSVTQTDYQVWRNAYGATGLRAADANGDGAVNAADYTLWRGNFGVTTSTPDPLDALVLYIDPLTGQGTLRNETDAAISLIGYSVLSDAAALLTADGDWQSLQDAGLTGWEEAQPTASALSELNPSGSLTLAAGDALDLGGLYDASASITPVQLEYAVSTSGLVQFGSVVFAEPTALPMAAVAKSGAIAAAEPALGVTPAPKLTSIESLVAPPSIETGSFGNSAARRPVTPPAARVNTDPQLLIAQQLHSQAASHAPERDAAFEAFSTKQDDADFLNSDTTLPELGPSRVAPGIRRGRV